MTDTDTLAEGTEPAAPTPTSTDAAENPSAGTDTPEQAENGSQPETDGSGDDDAEPRGRSAQYRKRAQDAEARAVEVEAQAAEHVATIERLQRLHVEQVVTAAGVKPGAVFAVTELADLLGEDGLPDPAKIEAAIDLARDQLGVRRYEHPVQRQLGMRSGAAGHPQPKKDGWAAAFSRRGD